MVQLAWKQLQEVDPKRNYLAYATFAERKSAWSYFSFIMRTRKVQEQAKTAKGLVGYAGRLEFSSKKVARVVVFEDESAMKAFAHAGQHANCIKEMKPSFKWSKRAIWSIPGSEIPPNLDDAINRIQSKQQETIRNE